jgi:hypothetical protein
MAMPLRAAIGLAMALLSLSVVFDELAGFLGQAVAVVQGAIRLLGP